MCGACETTHIPIDSHTVQPKPINHTSQLQESSTNSTPLNTVEILHNSTEELILPNEENTYDTPALSSEQEPNKHSNNSLPNCRFYMKGNCKFYHPPVCKPFMKNGNRNPNGWM